MQITPLLFLITLFVMDDMSLIEPVNPDIAEYFHIVIIAIIPAVLYLKKITKQAQIQYIHALQSEPDKIDKALQQLLQKTIIGMAIAEIPATVSILYYVFSGDLTWAVIIALISFALGLMFRPSLPGKSVL